MIINRQETRDTMNNEKPYDTGNMFLRGSSVYEDMYNIIGDYDTQAVDYIIHNEEGHNNNPNVGFISVRTVGALNAIGSLRAAGLTKGVNIWQSNLKERANTHLSSSGVIQKAGTDMKDALRGRGGRIGVG